MGTYWRCETDLKALEIVLLYKSLHDLYMQTISIISVTPFMLSIKYERQISVFGSLDDFPPISLQNMFKYITIIRNLTLETISKWIFHPEKVKVFHPNLD